MWYRKIGRVNDFFNHEKTTVLGFLNNLWGLVTEYRNRVIVLARQSTNL
jgi:hypothetical protein